MSHEMPERLCLELKNQVLAPSSKQIMYATPISISLISAAYEINEQSLGLSVDCLVSVTFQFHFYHCSPVLMRFSSEEKL